MSSAAIIRTLPSSFSSTGNCTTTMTFSHALSLKSHFLLARQPTFHLHLHPINLISLPPQVNILKKTTRTRTRRTVACFDQSKAEKDEVLVTSSPSPDVGSSSSSNTLLLSVAASVGIAILILGIDGKEAHALGPEGPLVEEFWDNMRRYGLYALTVSTGVVSAIAEPIVELLKNPITAILIITIVVGSGYLMSQVLSLMFGITEFSYDYAN